MTGEAAVSIVVICTGNICRSPMAQVLLQHDLEVRGVPASVSSAGTLDLREPAAVESVAAMADRGLDLTSHRSRVLTEETLAGADLVIGMAREHVRAAALIDPSCFARAFTLRELVRRAQHHGGPTRGEPLWMWGVSLTADREFADLLGESTTDDIADPIGQPRAVFERTANELSKLTSALAVTIAAGRSVDSDRAPRGV